MCAMYKKDIAKSNYNLSIDGLDIIAEEITPSESFNRRETSRKSILGGTQTVIRTNYIVRDFNVVAHFMIDPLFPDVYDNVFREWQSKPVEVICKEMGGKFDAECIIKRSTEDSPQYLKLDIQLIEIPDNKSLIPNENFKSPTNKESKSRINVKATSKKKSKKQEEKKNNKKSDKKSKKSSKNSKKKTKGSKITKTKKNS